MPEIRENRLKKKEFKEPEVVRRGKPKHTILLLRSESPQRGAVRPKGAPPPLVTENHLDAYGNKIKRVRGLVGQEILLRHREKGEQITWSRERASYRRKVQRSLDRAADASQRIHLNRTAEVPMSPQFQAQKSTQGHFMNNTMVVEDEQYPGTRVEESGYLFDVPMSFRERQEERV